MAKNEKPRPNAGRETRKAMEAVSQIYAAGLLAGVRTWVDGSEVMANLAWDYYRNFVERVEAGKSQEGPFSDGDWGKRLRGNVRDYLRQMENMQIQFQANFEKRAFGIIDSYFGPEGT